MSDKRITQFDEVFSASSESIIPIVEDGVNYKIKKVNLFEVPKYDTLFNSIAINIATRNRFDYENVKTFTEYTVGETNIDCRNGFITFEYPVYNEINNTVDYEFEPDNIVKVNNLFVDIYNYDLIKDYNPNLIFTRYKPKNRKKFTDYTFSGYKTNETIDEVLRPAKIPITSNKSFFDFGQEFYFKGNGKPRGIPSNIKVVDDKNIYIGYIYFELKISIFIDGAEQISGPLKRFKLECRLINNGALNGALNKIVIVEI